MNIKYSLVLIICTLIAFGFINGNNAQCTCGGNGGKGGAQSSNIINANDPSVITDSVVKVFDHWDLHGAVFLYNQTDGYIQLPDQFRNNVQSFQSGIDVCFIKWYPREQIQIHAGDYHKNYAALTNFGQRMDGLYAGSCSEFICSLSK